MSSVIGSGVGSGEFAAIDGRAGQATDRSPDIWHGRTTWETPGGDPVEADYLCVEPEFVEATRAAIVGGTWVAEIPLGPRVLLIRIANVLVGILSAAGVLLLLQVAGHAL